MAEEHTYLTYWVDLRKHPTLMMHHSSSISNYLLGTCTVWGFVITSDLFLHLQFINLYTPSAHPQQLNPRVFSIYRSISALAWLVHAFEDNLWCYSPCLLG
jgi:hypothetical protein